MESCKKYYFCECDDKRDNVINILKIMHLKPGTLLQSGKYRIVRFINSGGFGCTYEAVHTSLDDRFAIKEFFVKDFCNRDENTSYVTVGTNSKKALVEKLKNKFIKEAKSIRKLHHNGIVKVSDVFEENGTAYYVMDYIEGRSLSQLIDEKGRLTETETMRYIRKISETLKYVHSKGMLHLDIKPGNIMIDEEDNPILIDFGTSKQYDEESGENTSTLLGKTPGYAPLEQMDNSVQKFYPATDIYALGATMYKMLTGITPPNAISRAAGSKMEMLPSKISRKTKTAVYTSMQILKEGRPQSIEEFLKSLDVKIETEDEVTDIDISVVPDPAPAPGPGPTPNPVPPPGPTPKPKKWLQMFMISLSLIGVIVLVFIMKPIKYECKYVDLGLSVKWGDCNIGADNAYDYGEYLKLGKANRKQNSTWRLPTIAELEELKKNCTWTWTTQGGKKGYKVTGPNGNSIFLPAAGCRNGASLLAGESGYYWSSTPYGSDTNRTYYLGFNSSGQYVDWYNRYYGRSVRPVLE